jgi:hypothetical protein
VAFSEIPLPMQIENISIFGIDCDILKTLPEIEMALRSVRRSDPDLIVFYASGVLTAGFLDIVKDTYASGCAVMLTANRLTAPAETNWLEKPVR